MSRDRITIWVWEIKAEYLATDKAADKSYYGHVALQTYRGGPEDQGYYMSFWPEIPIKWYERSQRGVFYSYQKDKLNLPEKIYAVKSFHLLTLDIDAINQAYKVFKSGDPSWTLDINCCQFVYRLIKAGLGVNSPTFAVNMVTEKSQPLDTFDHKITKRRKRILRQVTQIQDNFSTNPDYKPKFYCFVSLSVAALAVALGFYLYRNHACEKENAQIHLDVVTTIWRSIQSLGKSEERNQVDFSIAHKVSHAAQRTDKNINTLMKSSIATLGFFSFGALQLYNWSRKVPTPKDILKIIGIIESEERKNDNPNNFNYR